MSAERDNWMPTRGAGEVAFGCECDECGEDMEASSSSRRAAR